jgi:hypothetical protein
MTQPTPVPAVHDDRLCRLAVRDQVDRKARGLGFFGLLTALACLRHAVTPGIGIRNERTSDRPADYAFVVDATASTLSPAERAHLRATGQVPDWFLPEVERQAAKIKKSR